MLNVSFVGDGFQGVLTPIFLVDKVALPGWIEQHPEHRDWITVNGFSGEEGSFTILPGSYGSGACVLAVRSAEERVWALAALPRALPPGAYALDPSLDAALDVQSATDAALGWALESYAFTRYKAAKREPAKIRWPINADREEVSRLADAMYMARDLINTPAEDMGPSELVAVGEALAVQSGARVRVVRGQALLHENFPCIHAVGRASHRQPALLDLTWGHEHSPKVTLVGKGVCFDTGGLDIKSAEGMLDMKKDMAGAAIVLGLAQALMSARLPIRLRVLIPAVDNAIAGNSIRPSDILRTRAGKTVEIGNTDAEGRLILCDALAEADCEAPDLLIDCATLTGAARIALGPELQGMFCDDEVAAQALLGAASSVGDPMWRLPLWRPYRRFLDSNCADLNNVSGGKFGGAIVAALYLSEFVSDSKTWIHLDIAASNVRGRPGRPEGGEASCLRALYAFICERYL